MKPTALCSPHIPRRHTWSQPSHQSPSSTSFSSCHNRKKLPTDRFSCFFSLEKIDLINNHVITFPIQWTLSLDGVTLELQRWSPNDSEEFGKRHVTGDGGRLYEYHSHHLVVWWSPILWQTFFFFFLFMGLGEGRVDKRQNIYLGNNSFRIISWIQNLRARIYMLSKQALLF